MAQSQLLDQEFLHKLERLTLHWQKSFAGLVGGRIPSKFSGLGQEFLDHRHFHHGDDLRAVNWRAYMRLEKLFLKMFQVEPRIPVRILLDCSASMESKFDYARRLAGALCYVGLVRLDTICIQPFRDKLEESHLCSGGRHRFLPASEFLSGLRHGGPTDYMAVSRAVAGKYPQRGLLIILSDFLDDQDVERPLQFLADFGNEINLVQVWSPEDREPSWDGELDLVDAETGAHVEISVDGSSRKNYTAAFDQYSGRLQNVANRSGGRYVGLPTSAAIEDVIFDSLMRAGAIQ
ncbi:MAG: DUF58 domain-containing protein [Bryobacteraceae bacterium]|nr:DUF58 domain-containing protein [Bryobacteraceae bacterium]